jgi:arylsulfatase A-like enzyme
LFTGRWAHELSTGWSTPLDRTHATLAEALSDRGYEAVAFVGNTLFASRATGLGRGFARYRDYPVSVGQAVVSTAWGRALAGWPLLWKAVGYHDTLNRREAPSVTEDFVDWLDTRESGRPFFAFINFFDAHEPTFPPGRSGSFIGPGPRWTRFAHTSGLFAGTNAWYEAKWELSVSDREIYATGYDDAVRKADAALGSVLDALSTRGFMENTIVIVAGDHGEQLGEHHLFQHNNSLYLPALRVPLVVVAPGAPAGAVVDRVVSLRDVPATVLHLLGFPNAGFPGRSLLPEPEPSAADAAVLSYLEQDFVEREDYPVAKGRTTYALTSSRWHYIRNGDGSEELYDWAADPAETADLMGSGADSAAVRLRSEMDRLIRGR